MFSRCFLLHSSSNSRKTTIPQIFSPNAIKVAQLFQNEQNNRFSKTVIIQQQSLMDLIKKIVDQTTSSGKNNVLNAKSKTNGISVFAPSFSFSTPSTNNNNNSSEQNQNETVQRSLILFHGTGGQTTIHHDKSEKSHYNPQLVSLLSVPSKFYDSTETIKTQENSQPSLSDRVFLSSSMELAMNFASTDIHSKISVRNHQEVFSRFEELLKTNKNNNNETGSSHQESAFTEGKEFVSLSEERADALRSVLFEMKRSDEENANKDKKIDFFANIDHLVVKTILALQIDFFSKEALPITSETGPIVMANNNTINNNNFCFSEDAERIKNDKHAEPACCYTYFDVDTFQPCYGLLRRGKEKDYRVTTLAKIHFVVGEKSN